MVNMSSGLVGGIVSTILSKCITTLTFGKALLTRHHVQHNHSMSQRPGFNWNRTNIEIWSMLWSRS